MTIIGLCILYWVLHIMFAKSGTTTVKDDASGDH